ncbi:uncharacterized protein ColSpa_07163 [Colletotrichum spaethianum]|uniref:Uncharacterized protein n=1 Tax=Colletotrichum spaethianum TaxID=700344 RepID=A0AA37LEC9_9PEZI|nr:uncharacterized protein ColSpa_07163 [Colletotrichum spaethianum]GKT46982.1 hypothetical protein ColSpa_07163 [Colletotrichum spaethianum]
MCDSSPPPGVDKANRWELSSSGSSPRSDTSTTPNSLISSPGSPAETELSSPSLGSQGSEKSFVNGQSQFVVTPSFANYILVGNTPYAPGQVQAMREILQQARHTGEFPKTTAPPEDAQTIIEDYQYLQRLRDARGDPAVYPPPQAYNSLKVDIARRIKDRDELHGGPSNLQEMDHRVQNWMNSINKEARMLEITQAALQRKGINNPTQDDLDAIAEEFMQIAERTLLDVASPLRMNASRMEGNISRFDSQLDGFHGAMTTQISTLNNILDAQSNTFNGSVNMLNVALNTVTTDLHRLTSDLPDLITRVVQAAVQEQLTSLSHQHSVGLRYQANFEQPPGYVTATRSQHHHQDDRAIFTTFAHPVTSTTQVSGQVYCERTSHLSTPPTKSKLKRFLRCIIGKGRSAKMEGHRGANSV